MTANELADAVEGAGDNSFNDQASRMLRQQAKEIEALHKLVKEQDMKIINLAFDLEYAKRTDEFVKIRKCASGNILSDKAVKD